MGDKNENTKNVPATGAKESTFQSGGKRRKRTPHQDGQTTTLETQDSHLNLENSESISKQSGADKIPTFPLGYEGSSSTVQQPPIVATLRLDKDDEDYDMSHLRRGKAIIFNHQTFDPQLNVMDLGCASADEESLRSAFSNLGFHVIVHNDLTHSKLQQTISEVQEENHTDADCLVVAVLTHGNDEVVLARDTEYVVQDTILKPFTADKCPSLAGKPKMFFIQACRGGKTDDGLKVKIDGQRTQADSGTITCTLPCHADFLIAYSTVKGYLSYFEDETGSWFIQSLCSELLERGTSTDLLTLMTRVSQRVALMYESYSSEPELNMKKQIPSIVSMLIRKVYFTPEEKRIQEINKQGSFSSEERMDSELTNSTVVCGKAMSKGRTTVKMHEVCYNMKNKRRGKAIIFNHMTFNKSLVKEERTGTSLDRDRLKQQFQNLGFEVKPYEDLTYSQLLTKLETVQGEDHSDADCLVVVVLTHGVQSLLYAYDVGYPVDYLWTPFTADNCPSLAGKPKIFFIQACRGNTYDKGVRLQCQGRNTKADAALSYHTIPCCSDFVLAFSSTEGFQSFREEADGGWFISKLCDELENINKTRIDLLSLLTRVARRVALDCKAEDEEKKRQNAKNGHVQETLIKQVPSTISMLTKDVYFHKN